MREEGGGLPSLRGGSTSQRRGLFSVLSVSVRWSWLPTDSTRHIQTRYLLSFCIQTQHLERGTGRESWTRADTEPTNQRELF